MVVGKAIAGLSDGLHGEIFGAEGWMVRLSRNPVEKEIKESKEAADFIKEMLKKQDGEQGERGSLGDSPGQPASEGRASRIILTLSKVSVSPDRRR